MAPSSNMTKLLLVLFQRRLRNTLVIFDCNTLSQYHLCFCNFTRRSLDICSQALDRANTRIFAGSPIVTVGPLLCLPFSQPSSLGFVKACQSSGCRCSPGCSRDA